MSEEQKIDQALGTGSKDDWNSKSLLWQNSNRNLYKKNLVCKSKKKSLKSNDKLNIFW